MSFLNFHSFELQKTIKNIQLKSKFAFTKLELREKKDDLSDDSSDSDEIERKKENKRKLRGKRAR